MVYQEMGNTCECYHYRFKKSFDSITVTRYTCTQHLSDTNFFGALLGSKHGKPKQTKTGNKNGKPGEDAQYRPDFLFSLIGVIKTIIQERIGQWIFSPKVDPCFLKCY